MKWKGKGKGNIMIWKGKGKGKGNIMIWKGKGKGNIFTRPTPSPMLPPTPTTAPSIQPIVDFEGQDDWEQGASINLLVSDNLQLQGEALPFNFIWIAASGRGTVMKINTLTGDIIGEYKSGPDSAGFGNPSRTTVDAVGSIWVTNRDHFPGSVVHIGLAENNQCEDRNGNGVIDTSTGKGDILDWLDETGDRGVATADDECIVVFTGVSSSGTRHLSLDKDNNLWVGGYLSRSWDLIKGGRYDDPNHGSILQNYPSVEYGGYGGLIDKNNVLWSASPLLRWNVSLPLEGPNGDPIGSDIGPPRNGTNWAGSSAPFTYGLCIDSTGNVWATSFGDQVYKFSPEGVYLGTFFHGGSSSQGCVVGLDDDVWVAHSLYGSSVGRIRNNGTLVGVVPVGSGPTGVAVDGAGKIWSANINDNSLTRIDPSLNDGLGAVDLFSVDLGEGAGPYNYGDMTGSTNTAPPSQGSWTFSYNSGNVDQEWGIFDWEADTPSDSQVVVEARSSTDRTTFSAYERAIKGTDLSLPSGQYLEIRVLLIRASTGETPVVNGLAIFYTPAPV